MYKDSEENPAICGKYISFIFRKSVEYMTHELKGIGLSATQSVVLVGVFRSPGVNQRNLSDMLALDPAVASRSLHQLETAGYIHKIVDPSSRRNFKLYLTESGQQITQKSLDIQGRYWNRVLEPLGTENVGQLKTLLRDLQLQVYEFISEQ